jgi:hypothetical protein
MEQYNSFNPASDNNSRVVNVYLNDAYKKVRICKHTAAQ